MQAVILAGGKGERLGNKEIPKAMVKIGDKPILQHQVELLGRQRTREIILCTKHLSGEIRKHFRDGSEFGVRITYSEEEDFLGTAGALKLAEEYLDEDFILLYSDVMLNMNLSKLFEHHRKKKGLATLVVHESDHPEDSDIVEADKEMRIRRIFRPGKGERFRNLTNAAVFALKREVTEHIPAGKFLNLERDVLPTILEKGKPVYAYETEEYVKDMGTPGRLEKVRKDYEIGKVFRKAVFLDRDGVINEDVSFLSKPSQMRLIRGSAEAVKMLKDSGFLVIAVTNQPVVARNMCTEEDLARIHERMEELLSEKGAKLDAIYYCPHHPDKGYPGENPKYKIDCECRKPKPGMVFQASNDFGIEPSGCFVVGDRTSDIKMGRDAGCRTVLVRTGRAGKDGKFDIRPDYVCENLLEAARLIIKNRRPR